MTEAKLQELIVEWLSAALPADSVFHHSPNEGKRHVAFKQKLATMGTRWGWPDLELVRLETRGRAGLIRQLEEAAA